MKVTEWAENVKTLRRYATTYQQADSSGLAMLLQSEWNYLQWDVPGVGASMGPVEEVLVGSLFMKFLSEK